MIRLARLQCANVFIDFLAYVADRIDKRISQNVFEAALHYDSCPLRTLTLLQLRRAVGLLVLKDVRVETANEVGHEVAAPFAPGLRAVGDSVHADEVEETNVGHHGVHAGEHSTGDAPRLPYCHRKS